MRSPLTALLWERWQRTRLIIALAFGLSIAAIPLAERTPEAAREVGVLSGLLLLGGLLLGHCERDDIRGGLPERALRLPVASATLTAVHMGYGAAWMTLYGLVFSWSLLSETPALGWHTVWWSAMMWPCAYVCAQAVSWLFGPHTAVTAALFAPLVWLAWAYALWPQAVAKQAAIPWYWLLSALMLPGCFALGVVAVRNQRRGTAAVWLVLPLWRRFSRRWKARRAFASPIWAQAWYEWRRKGMLLPAAFLGVVLVWSLFVRASGYVDQFGGNDLSGSLPDALTWATVLLATAALIVALLGYAIERRDRDSGTENFQFVRPVSTVQLSAARLGVSAASVLVTLGLLIAVAVLSPAWRAGAVPSVRYAGRSLALLPLAALLAWTFLRVGPALLLLPWAVFWSVLGLASVLDLDTPSAQKALCIAMAVSFFGAWALLFVVAFRRGLLPRLAIEIVALLLLMAVASSAAFADFAGLHPSRWPEAFILLIAILLPSVPLVLAPLLLDWHRHR